MMKILYVDVPFADEKGGDKNRSRFLWKQVCSQFDADLIIVQKRSEYSREKLDAHNDYKKIYSLVSRKPKKWKSQLIYSFSRKEQGKFRKTLAENHYDVVLFRFSSQAVLAKIVRKCAPRSKIIIDVDMLFSRIAVLSWEKNPVFKNRLYYFEKNRLRRFEKSFFQKPYYFFFANPLERDYVLDKYKPKHVPDDHFQILPNVMDSAKSKIASNAGKDILFFGTLSSTANEDAFLYMANWILPLIRDDLVKAGVKIRVVGKDPTIIYQSFANDEVVEIVGPVDDIDQEIYNSRFIFLPLRIGSGTRTRILEAAAQGKTVVTTAIGIEGFPFTSEEMVLGNLPQDLANSIRGLLNREDLVKEYGRKLYQRSTEEFLDQNVANRFADFLKKIPDL